MTMTAHPAQAPGDPHGKAPLPSARAVSFGVVLLSFASGAMDAFAFLCLGGIFTANMTGNLILAGMFTRPGFPATLAGASVAVVVFAGVLFAGFRVTDDFDARRHHVHPHVPGMLVVAVIMQTVVVTWPLWHHHGDPTAQLVTIALSAASLALQTAGAKRLTAVGAVTTTYVTGTLTTVMQDLADRRAHGEGIRVASIAALPVGAVAATVVVAVAPVAAPATSWVAAVVAVLLIHRGLGRPTLAR